MKFVHKNVKYITTREKWIEITSLVRLKMLFTLSKCDDFFQFPIGQKSGLYVVLNMERYQYMPGPYPGMGKLFRISTYLFVHLRNLLECFLVTSF